MLSFESKIIIFNTIFVRVNQIKGVLDLETCMGGFFFHGEVVDV